MHNEEAQRQRIRQRHEREAKDWLQQQQELRRRQLEAARMQQEQELIRQKELREEEMRRQLEAAAHGALQVARSGHLFVAFEFTVSQEQAEECTTNITIHQEQEVAATASETRDKAVIQALLGEIPPQIFIGVRLYTVKLHIRSLVEADTPSVVTFQAVLELTPMTPKRPKRIEGAGIFCGLGARTCKRGRRICSEAPAEPTRKEDAGAWRFSFAALADFDPDDPDPTDLRRALRRRCLLKVYHPTQRPRGGGCCYWTRLGHRRWWRTRRVTRSSSHAPRPLQRSVHKEDPAGQLGIGARNRTPCTVLANNCIRLPQFKPFSIFNCPCLDLSFPILHHWSARCGQKSMFGLAVDDFPQVTALVESVSALPSMQQPLPEHTIVTISECQMTLFDIRRCNFNIEFLTRMNLNRPVVQIISSLSPSIFYQNYQQQLSVAQINMSVFEPPCVFMKLDHYPGQQMACHVMYRGDVVPKDMRADSGMMKTKRALQFMDWRPTGFKHGINYVPSSLIHDGDLAKACQDLAVLEKDFEEASSEMAEDEVWDEGCGNDF